MYKKEATIEYYVNHPNLKDHPFIQLIKDKETYQNLPVVSMKSKQAIEPDFTIAGRCWFKDEKTALQIEINFESIKKKGAYSVENVIIHEILHAYLHYNLFRYLYFDSLDDIKLSEEQKEYLKTNYSEEESSLEEGICRIWDEQTDLFKEFEPLLVNVLNKIK